MTQEIYTTSRRVSAKLQERGGGSQCGADRGRKQSPREKFMFVEPKTQRIRAAAKCEAKLHTGKLNF